MRRVFFASRFEKKLKLFHSRHPELSTAVKDTMLAIAGDPHAPALKTCPPALGVAFRANTALSLSSTPIASHS
jgi:hypothetical protein